MTLGSVYLKPDGLTRGYIIAPIHPSCGHSPNICQALALRQHSLKERFGTDLPSCLAAPLLPGTRSVL